MRPIAILTAALLAAPFLSAQGARLGVTLQPADGGVVIAEVQDGTAAALTGLAAGDRILAFDGHKVESLDDLVQAVRRHSPGDVVSIELRRDGEVLARLLVLGRGEAAGPGDAPFLGVMLRNPAEGRGVEVVRVLPESAAHVLGLRKGDVILALDGQPVPDTDALGAALAGLRAGDVVSLTARREGEVLRLRGILGRRPADLEEEEEPEALEEFGHHEEADEAAHPGPPHTGAWHPNLEAALTAARHSGKPVLVDFSATWCGPCQALGREVLHNEDHAGLIARFEAVQVDVDEKPEVAKEYGVRSIPDVRILDAKGQEIDRFVGYSGAEATVQRLQEVLEKAGTRRAEADRAAAGAKAQQQARQAEIRARRARIETRIRELQKEIQELRRELEELRRLQP